MAPAPEHPAFQPLCDPLDLVHGQGAPFWGHDDLGSRGQGGHSRQLAAVPTHDLEHHDSVMTDGRVSKVSDRPGQRVDSRIHPQRHLGHRQVVVDRRGNSDHPQVTLVDQATRASERSVAATDNHRADPQGLQEANHLPADLRLMELGAPRRTQHDAPSPQQAADRGLVQEHQMLVRTVNSRQTRVSIDFLLVPGTR